jgi:hypothetical protein
MPAGATLADYTIGYTPATPTLTYSWDNSKTYQIGDICRLGSNYYSCIQKDNLNNNPSTSTGFWTLFNESFQYEIDQIGYYMQNEINALYANPAGYVPKVFPITPNYYTEMINLVAADSPMRDNTLVAYYVLTEGSVAAGLAGGFGAQMVLATAFLQAYIAGGGVPPYPPYGYVPGAINSFLEISMAIGINIQHAPSVTPPFNAETILFMNYFNLFLIDAFLL